MSDFKLLIGGALVPGDATMEVINPATGQPFLTVPRASVAQADAAIAAAKAAQPAGRHAAGAAAASPAAPGRRDRRAGR
jgi:acyl-CoA reductase-like NAD-dependent aldehyde dehydrogenase